MIKVCNYQFKIPEDVVAVNTTSRSFTWSKGLSPFFLGPVDLYDGHVSANVENGWQFSKVYYNHVDSDDNPNVDYFNWAQAGWTCPKANRYPMGKGAKPLFSYWAGEKLSYTEARQKIYIPLYSGAVGKTQAFEKLKKVYEECLSNGQILHLIDFDAHNLTPGTFEYLDLWNNANIKVGHAYVLAMMLEGLL